MDKDIFKDPLFAYIITKEVGINGISSGGYTRKISRTRLLTTEDRDYMANWAKEHNVLYERRLSQIHLRKEDLLALTLSLPDHLTVRRRSVS